jgi:hypothetical protein
VSDMARVHGGIIVLGRGSDGTHGRAGAARHPPPGTTTPGRSKPRARRPRGSSDLTGDRRATGKATGPPNGSPVPDRLAAPARRQARCFLKNAMVRSQESLAEGSW